MYNLFYCSCLIFIVNAFSLAWAHYELVSKIDFFSFFMCLMFSIIGETSFQRKNEIEILLDGEIFVLFHNEIFPVSFISLHFYFFNFLFQHQRLQRAQMMTRAMNLNRQNHSNGLTNKRPSSAHLILLTNTL